MLSYFNLLCSSFSNALIIAICLKTIFYEFSGGSPDIDLLSGSSYTSGHSGCLGDVMIGTNSTTASFIPLVPVFGVEVTRCSS